jgi:hypothetical protein
LSTYGLLEPVSNARLSITSNPRAGCPHKAEHTADPSVLVSTGSDNNNQRDNPAMRRIGATKSTIAKIDAKIDPNIDPKVICYR